MSSSRSSAKRKGRSLAKKESEIDADIDKDDMGFDEDLAASETELAVKAPHPLLRSSSLLDLVSRTSTESMNAGAVESTMNPKALLTGLYGSRGERIRHIVHEGALRLPQEALDILIGNMEYVGTSLKLSTQEDQNESRGKKKSKVTRKAHPYKLPALDSVKRPSLDIDNLGSIKVTYLYGEVIPGGTALAPEIRSVAQNKIITKNIINPHQKDVSSASDLERIRGGGGDDMEVDPAPTGPELSPMKSSGKTMTAVVSQDQSAVTVENQTLNMKSTTDTSQICANSAPVSLATSNCPPSSASSTLPMGKHETMFVGISNTGETSYSQHNLTESMTISTPNANPTQVLSAGAPDPQMTTIPTSSVTLKTGATVAAEFEQSITPSPLSVPPKSVQPVASVVAVSVPNQMVTAVAPSATIAGPLPSNNSSQSKEQVSEIVGIPSIVAKPVRYPALADNKEVSDNFSVVAQTPFVTPLLPASTSVIHGMNASTTFVAPPPTDTKNQHMSPVNVPPQPEVRSSLTQSQERPHNPHNPLSESSSVRTAVLEAAIVSTNQKQTVQLSSSFQSSTPPPSHQTFPNNSSVSTSFPYSAIPVPYKNAPSFAGSFAPSAALSVVASNPDISIKHESSHETSLTSTIEPQIIPLKKRPAPHWTLHETNSNDDLHVNLLSKTPKPAWFKVDRPSDLEMTVLPEWFDGSAPHRSEATYIQARNKMMTMCQRLGHNRFITSTMVRRSIPGDAGSLIRLHSFLTSYALINEDAINDSAPTPLSFQQQPLESSYKQQTMEDPWNNATVCDQLLEAVVQQTNRKKPKLDDKFVPIIDWTEIADVVGHGVLPSDCERHFLSMSINNSDPFSSQERPITPDVTGVGGVDSPVTKSFRTVIQKNMLQDIIGNCDPNVVSSVTDAALRSVTASSEHSDQTSKSILSVAQEASIFGLTIAHAAAEARSEEDAVSRILAEIVELRMQKLENRMAMLDDVEGMLEAERVALELERRDLYTARCRHWFGGT